jgi:hypothetical protein
MPAAVLGALQQRKQRGERVLGVTDHRDVHRVLAADHPRLHVDLNRPSLPGLRIELRPRVVAPHDQQGVAFAHQLGACRGAEVSHHPGVPRRALVEHGLAEQ